MCWKSGSLMKHAKIWTDRGNAARQAGGGRVVGVSPLATLVALALLFPVYAGAATPITNTGTPTTLPAYSGAPAKKKPIKVQTPPQNPFMAKNGRSNVHNDAWMSDAYSIPGPSGRSPVTFSATIGGRVCISLAFDRKGRLVAACPSLAGPRLYMFDPFTLDTLAEFALPFVPPVPGQDPFLNTTGGAYFYLDNQDRAVLSTTDGHIWIVAETGGKSDPGFALEQDFDLSAVVGTDRFNSALPDWQGRIWFIARYTGMVGVPDPGTGNVGTTVLNEEIQNSFAVDEDAVYIVSDTAMYRFEAGVDDVPTVVWSFPYQSIGIHKPGQINAGSGTTPTLMAGGYVAITDNADPMNVVVYRKAATLAPGEQRTVCEVPVFETGASATDNSLIAAGNSLIVENNYGYGFATTVNGAVTSPGFARVDVNAEGTGCALVWTNTTERGASVVPKASLKTGLVYTFTKDPDPVNATADAWFWTALDFETGQTVWKQLAGTGVNFNNHYAGLVLGKKRHIAYLGVFGGIIAIRDGK